jgi:hypothetical protein
MTIGLGWLKTAFFGVVFFQHAGPTLAWIAFLLLRRVRWHND